MSNLEIDLGTSDLFLRTFDSDGTFQCWVCGKDLEKDTECIALIAKSAVDLALHPSCCWRLSALFEIFAIDVEDQNLEAELQGRELPLKLELGPRIDRVQEFELYQLFELDRMEVYIESFPTERSVILKAITPGTWRVSKQTITLFRSNSKPLNRKYETVEVGNGITPLPVKQ